MSLISGTKYYIDLTINQDLVFTSREDYLYCFKLKNITNSDVWSEITSSSNIGVVDAITGLQCQKSILGTLDINNKEGILYWNCAIQNNSRFYICIGSNINVADTNNTFTDINITDYFPMHESGSPDILYGLNHNIDTLYKSYLNFGIENDFFKGVERSVDTSGLLQCDSKLFNEYFSLSFLLKFNYTAGHYATVVGASPFLVTFKANSSLLSISYNNGSQFIDSNFNFNDPLQLYYVSIYREQSNYFNIYVNGNFDSRQLLTIQSEASTTTHFTALTGAVQRILGNISQFEITSNEPDAYTEDYEKTKYSMFINNTSFFGNNFTPITASKPYKNRVNLRLGMCM